MQEVLKMLKKYWWILVILIVVTVLYLVIIPKTTPSIAMKTQAEKISYGIGLDVGTRIKQQEINIDMRLFDKGVTDAISGTKPLLTKDELNKVFAAMQKEWAAKQNERQAKLAEKNQKDGAAFLAANKNKEGVITLPDGLQYKVLKAGTGPKPTIRDTVTVQYRGTLIDGTEFDSSYKRGQPMKISLSRIIPGWKEALPLMKAGSKWQLFIPSNLAYGEKGAAPEIGPNAVLIFEVELMAVD
jgi:FKBP-type peptidyl-prolyl cis-trans isomerase FklB